jgi:hypothetical protein
MELAPHQTDLFGPQPDQLIVGIAVQLPDRCIKCGGAVAVIGPGKAPHKASLHCQTCDHHRGWVSRISYDFIANTVATFGRPDEPILVRRGSSIQ